MVELAGVDREKGSTLYPGPVNLLVPYYNDFVCCKYPAPESVPCMGGFDGRRVVRGVTGFMVSRTDKKVVVKS
ncbi:hypothetical protein ACI3E1_01845 [Ligilactobacillus sp. LYQ139]|uniref:hypothetical protein n=1 Tax=Ligilactobacillus sp. LYQ139 TaxID=3378800 RepID=UPI003851B06B